MARPAYLDTNPVIRFIESEDHGLLRAVGDAAAGFLEPFTSEPALGETLVGPLKLHVRCTPLLSSDSAFKAPPGLARIALENVGSEL